MHTGFVKALLFVFLGCLIAAPSFGAVQDADHLPRNGEDLLPYLELIAFNEPTKPFAPVPQGKFIDLLWTTSFITGVFEAVRAQAYEDKKDVTCIGPTPTTSQTVASNQGLIAKGAILYMQKRPEMKTQPPIAIIYMTIVALYPCVLSPAKPK